MRQGDRVTLAGRVGTVVGFMPAGMVDVQFDDAGWTERKEAGLLQPMRSMARRNSGRPDRRERRSRSQRKGRRGELALWNPDEPEEVEQPQAAPPTVAETSTKHREQQSAYKRTAGQPLKQKFETDLQTMLPKRGAVMFTEEDPPRMSSDRQVYCGNPVDGTAYYIVVSSQKRALGRYVTKEEIRTGFFRDDRKQYPVAPVVQPGEKGYPDFLKRVTKYLNGLERRGVDVVEERVRSRQVVRPRAGMGMRSELAIKEKKVGPVGKEADPAIHFSIADERGTLTFYIVYEKKSPGRVNLDRFQPFAKRQFSAPRPETLPQGTPFGLLSLAVAFGSKAEVDLGPVGIHPAVAEALVLSGAVGVNYAIQTNPDFAVKAGDEIQVWLKDKAESPYFSWVGWNLPIREAKAALNECISGDDLKVRAALGMLRSMLGRLDGAFGRVRALFRKLVERGTGALQLLAVQPTRPKDDKADVYQAVLGLANAYAALWRWYARIAERGNQGDPIAHRVSEIFLQTDLNPGDESSPFYQTLANFQARPDFMGFVVGDQWVTQQVPESIRGRAGLKAAYLINAEQRLTRRGAEFQLLDKDLGIYQYRVPMTRVKPDIRDRDSYDEFMVSLLNLVAVPEQPLEGDASSAIAAAPFRPGRSALLYFLGGRAKQAIILGKEVPGLTTSVLPHPMDDMFGYVHSSLHPEALPNLVEMRKTAGSGGVHKMRWSAPKRAGDEVDQARTDPAWASAVQFRQLMGIYGVGGLRTTEGSIDPLDRRFAFELRPVPGPVSPDQQLDMNWVINLIVNGVFPSLVWEEGVSPEDAGKESKDLLLLAMLYELMGGHAFVGPLNPEAKTGRATSFSVMYRRQKRLAQLQERVQQAGSPQEAAHLERLFKRELDRPKDETAVGLLKTAQQQVSDAEAQLMGGSSGLSSKDYKTYKTYNPVLFEMTRLFWPSKEQAIPFGNVLAYPDKVADLDAIGRFAHAVQTTQSLAAQSQSPAEVTHKLGQLLSLATQVDLKTLMGTMERFYQYGSTGPGPFSTFLLNWPLNRDFDDAIADGHDWNADPIRYLAALKERMEVAVSKVRGLRRTGMPMPAMEKRAIPAGDMPFIQMQGRPPITPRSVVRAERSDDEAELLTAISEIDRAIEALGGVAKKNRRRR